eukprot:4267984-Pleurochrysis_carterae.AAC.8
MQCTCLAFPTPDARVHINAAAAHAPICSLCTSARAVLGDHNTYARPGRESPPCHAHTFAYANTRPLYTCELVYDCGMRTAPAQQAAPSTKARRMIGTSV